MGRYMTSFSKTRIIQNSQIISHEFEGKVYLLDPQRNVVRALNDTAGFIWQNTGKNIKVEELTKVVMERFNAPANSVGEDVMKFVKKYLKLGLLEVV